MGTHSHELGPKQISLALTGTDDTGAFIETIVTTRIAAQAFEFETPRRLSVGTLIHVDYKGAEGTFEVVEVSAGQGANRVTLESLGRECLWTSELGSAQSDRKVADRRRSARFGVLGQVMVFQLTGASGIMRPFKLVEISPHGCYIESRTPLPVGAEVSLRITLSNLTVDCHGVVRSSNQAIGMGVEIQRFETPDDRVRYERILIDAAAAAAG